MENPPNQINLLPFRSQSLSPLDKGFHRSVRDWFSGVWTQQRGSCMAMSSTHMLTIIYRMRTNNRNLQISPNAVLRYVNNVDGINPAVLQQALIEGLEEHQANEPFYESIQHFQYTAGRDRFSIQRLDYISGMFNMLFELRKNFGLDGHCYPIIGLCNPWSSPLRDALIPQNCSLSNPEVAFNTSMVNPYRYSTFCTSDDSYTDVMNFGFNPMRENHAVLITGMFTMANEPENMDFAIEIKNSHGINWGQGGYAWVTADLFYAILVPVLGDA